MTQPYGPSLAVGIELVVEAYSALRSEILKASLRASSAMGCVREAEFEDQDLLIEVQWLTVVVCAYASRLHPQPAGRALMQSWREIAKRCMDADDWYSTVASLDLLDVNRTELDPRAIKGEHKAR